MCITSLSTLLQGIVDVPSVFDVTIHGLKTDSREVTAGDTFVAMSGTQAPADHYVDAAIDAGATVVLLEAQQAGECNEYRGALMVPVTGLKAWLGILADRFFEHPSQRLRVLGVTGTNGKTSVAHYVAQLLNATGTPCGLMGTLGYGMAGRLLPATHTTPDPVRINRGLFHILSQGGRAAAIEVSSHALEQGRIDGINVTGAIFTNLTRDHLDYHGSMAAYGRAKARLFAREELHFAVINFDDPFGRQLFDQLEGQCDRVRYSLHESQTELWLTRFEPLQDGFRATVDGLWGAFSVNASLLGAFNVSNLLAGMGAVLSLGVPLARVIEAVPTLTPPPGRLELYRGKNDIQVVVDYAHTPDALKNALTALRPHVTGQLVCVFGCGGDRDSGKRPEMALVAEELADRIVVTDDNPRSEQPDAIVKDILAGFSDSCPVEVIHDRASAIQTAIAQASAGDVVLVAGKGHESWQEIAGARLPFNDAEQVRAALSLTGGVA